MKIIEPSVENITPTKYDINSIYKHIELCGRNCYKSQDKITEDSYKKFCDNIKNNKHLSVFEHGTVYLKVPVTTYSYLHYSGEDCDRNFDYYDTHRSINPYTKMTIVENLNTLKTYAYITTNMRVIIEHGWEDDLKYLCEPTEYHEKRYTFKVVCDRAVLAEFTRHRTLSFSVESQRYCNYSKDKYGNEVTFVRPHWFESNMSNEENDNLWYNAMLNAEHDYLSLLDTGIKPQDARTVLPNSCKTEIVVTGFKSDWEHFLSLRSPKAGATGVHPDMQIIANKIFELLK